VLFICQECKTQGLYKSRLDHVVILYRLFILCNTRKHVIPWYPVYKQMFCLYRDRSWTKCVIFFVIMSLKCRLVSAGLKASVCSGFFWDHNKSDAQIRPLPCDIGAVLEYRRLSVNLPKSGAGLQAPGSESPESLESSELHQPRQTNKNNPTEVFGDSFWCIKPGLMSAGLVCATMGLCAKPGLMSAGLCHDGSMS